MLAPPIPGKRREKLRFNLSLLFTEKGEEYSVQEARARSMGLLGKKWGPPPASEFAHCIPLSSNTAQVSVKDDQRRKDRNTTTQRSKNLTAPEPTVTINTKEALADVFGMFNSPEKTTRLARIPGSKHAPLKKVELAPPIFRPPPTLSSDEEAPTPAGSNEGLGSTKAGSSFTPFVDAVFTRPSPHESAVFAPLSRSENASSSTSRPPLANRPLANRPLSWSADVDEDEVDDDDDDDQVPLHDPREDTTQSTEDEGYDDAESYRAAPLRGRFGQFNVMTPITERTFEHTTATSLEYIEEKTGTLSLIDALTVSSKFKPPNPCNPFDPPILVTLLSLFPTDEEYHYFKDCEANQLEPLRKFTKRARKMSGDTINTGVFSLPSAVPITLGDRQFNVIAKLGEGAFGTVFQAMETSADGASEEDEDEEDSAPMIALKVVKPRNVWEYHVLRRLHSVLPVHLRRSVILPHALYAYRDESFLILDLCPQGSLLDIVNNSGTAGVSQQGACLDELLAIFFSIELLRLIGGMHTSGFIHGDLKIDNCLLRLEDVPGGASGWSSLYQPSGKGGWDHKGVKVIDFGRTIDTRLFPAGQTFIAEWSVDERDCLEMRENRPWTFQTDYFGLAGIIYCMLFGKYIQSSSLTGPPGEYKIATPFKRYWQTDLWSRLFHLLLNPGTIRPDGHLPISEELGTLRQEMEAWLQSNCNRSSNTLKGLLKKVEMAAMRGSTR
jgi:checkpoint serine/threonine-protein kinase